MTQSEFSKVVEEIGKDVIPKARRRYRTNKDSKRIPNSKIRWARKYIKSKYSDLGINLETVFKILCI